MSNNIRKVRSSLTITPQALEQWVKSYETTGRLPSPEIPCSKCGDGITATHGNLRGKVAAHGSIRALLVGFVCRSCTRLAKPKAVETPKPDRPKRPRKVRTESGPLVADEQGRYNIPNVNLNPIRQSYTIEDIAASAELTKEFTNETCLKPQLFLNSDNVCDHCELYANCGARCKTLSRAKLRALAKA